MDLVIKATIGANLIINHTHLRVGPAGIERVTERVASEHRPVNLSCADTALAFHGYGRTEAWDLDGTGSVCATVEKIDNTFGGTAAARLDSAVGRTHAAFDSVHAQDVAAGDLITDRDHSAYYVVAAFSTEDGVTRISMVGEGKTWNERHAGGFDAQEYIQVARRKA
jgi:hypothetical protein